MHKKLLAACMTVAVFAAIAASGASASPVLTENFTPLPVGATVAATNTGSTLFTDREITEECQSLKWFGTVLQNSGTKIQLEFPSGEEFYSDGGTSCTSPVGNFVWKFKSKLCFETVSKTDNISVTGCGGANVVFAIGACEYSATSMTGTFVTNSDATITFSKQSFERISGLFMVGSIPCTTPASIDLLLDLTTTNETTLSIS